MTNLSESSVSESSLPAASAAAETALADAKQFPESYQFNYPSFAQKLPDGIKDSSESPQTTTSSRSRTSDIFDPTLPQTPADLVSSLSQYMDIKPMLHFSFIETLTKREYEAAIKDMTKEEVICADFHLDEANAVIEQMKEVKNMVKEWATGCIEDVEEVSMRVGSAAEDLSQKMAELEKVTSERRELEKSIPEEIEKIGGEGEGFLSLDETLQLVREAKRELEHLDEQLEQVTMGQIPRKQTISANLDQELKLLEMQHKASVGVAEYVKELRKKERESEMADKENVGRWYQATQEAFTQLINPE